MQSKVNDSVDRRMTVSPLGQVAGTVVCEAVYSLKDNQVRKAPWKLAKKLGQLQPFTAVFPQECMGQLASVGLT